MSVMVLAGFARRVATGARCVRGKEDMAEFAFDMVLNTVVRVDADSLEQAVAYLREQLDCWSPGEGVGIALPTGGADGVERAALTQVSLGGGAALDALAVFEVEGEPLDHVNLDGMANPRLCDRFSEADGVDCHEVYDEARGDGYMGECPAHADTGEKG